MSAPERLPPVYFHAGLGKAASTYLQQQVFPRLRGVSYVPPTAYRRSPGRVARREGPMLVSREFDRQLAREAAWFAQHVEEVRPLIVFRRHDGWIASQYRRHVKNGFAGNFRAFLDLANDQGYWKLDETRFMPHLHALESSFGRPPLVLFHEELKETPEAFFQKLTTYTETTLDHEKLPRRATHRSYSDKQLKFMRRAAPHLYPRGDIQTPGLHWLWRRSRLLLSYGILFWGNILPEGKRKHEPLIPAEELSAVRTYFAEDWQAVQAYAEAHNPLLLRGESTQPAAKVR